MNNNKIKFIKLTIGLVATLLLIMVLAYESAERQKYDMDCVHSYGWDMICYGGNENDYL